MFERRVGSTKLAFLNLKTTQRRIKRATCPSVALRTAGVRLLCRLVSAVKCVQRIYRNRKLAAKGLPRNTSKALTDEASGSQVGRHHRGTAFVPSETEVSAEPAAVVPLLSIKKIPKGMVALHYNGQEHLVSAQAASLLIKAGVVNVSTSASPASSTRSSQRNFSTSRPASSPSPPPQLSTTNPLMRSSGVSSSKSSTHSSSKSSARTRSSSRKNQNSKRPHV